MFELIVCSLVTIIARLSLPPLCPEQAVRQGDHVLFGLVRAQMGHHGMSDAYDLADNDDLLFSSLDHQRHAVLQDGPDPSRGSGRVAEVNVGFSAPVSKGDVIFRLDSSKQEAALETAKRKIAEVDAAMVTAEADVAKAEAQIQEAKAQYQQAKDELDVKSELQRRNPGIVPQRDIEKAAGARRSAPGRDRCGGRGEAIGDLPGLDALAGGKGERRSGVGAGPGGSGQDLCPRRRRWPGRAVRAAHRRCGQSTDAARRRFSSRKARASGCCRRALARSRLRS